MQKVMAFISLSLDGYYADRKSDMSWAHRGPDPEFDAFVATNAKGGGVLLFGRVTYEMMASYWPTPAAQRDNPTVAGEMNARRKVVFSKTLKNAAWANTEVESDLVGAVRRIKNEPGDGLVILGSGTVVAQLAEAGLLDEVQVVVVPVALGGGKSLFGGVKQPVALELAGSRAFKNGSVFLIYRTT